VDKPIADLHCHPSLKPHLNDRIPDIWRRAENPLAHQVFARFSIRKLVLAGTLNKLARVTQSNLDACFEGRNRLVVCSLYPFEREFLRPDRPFKRASLLVRTGLQLLLGRRYRKSVDLKLIRLITGISEKWTSWFLGQVHGQEVWIDYFRDYQREYNYLKDSQGPRPGDAAVGSIPEFRLVRSFAELEALEGRPVICGILSLEGLHGIGRYPKKALRGATPFEDLMPEEQEAIRTSLFRNLDTIKMAGRGTGSDPDGIAPFFVTFSHHMNNFLAGHARSFGGLLSRVFNQQPGLGLGFSALGEEMVGRLLERREDAGRILIDTKHLSLKARGEYYRRVGNMRNRGDNVPVIASHTAVNGLADLATAAGNDNDPRIERRSYISRFSINLTDEDIREILKSDGLIGICMHDGRMPGRKFKRKLKAVRAYREKAKRLYAQLFLTNVFHIVRVGEAYLASGGRVAGSADPWKTVALGSDNDGIVDPFDTYRTAADFPAFRKKLIEALKTQERPYMREFRILSLPGEVPMPAAEIARLMNGQTPEEVVDRIFYSNVRHFLKKYFNDAYRYAQPIA